MPFQVFCMKDEERTDLVLSVDLSLHLDPEKHTSPQETWRTRLCPDWLSSCRNTKEDCDKRGTIGSVWCFWMVSLQPRCLKVIFQFPGCGVGGRQALKPLGEDGVHLWRWQVTSVGRSKVNCQEGNTQPSCFWNWKSDSAVKNHSQIIITDHFSSEIRGEQQAHGCRQTGRSFLLEWTEEKPQPQFC